MEQLKYVFEHLEDFDDDVKVMFRCLPKKSMHKLFDDLSEGELEHLLRFFEIQEEYEICAGIKYTLEKKPVPQF